MVVDVQEAELLPSLLEDDEHSVQKVQDLGQVEHVQDEGDGGSSVVELIARKQRVASRPGAHAGLNAHVRAKHDLEHVVGELEGIQSLHGRQKRHQDLAQEHEGEVADGNGESVLQLGQRPILNEGSCTRFEVSNELAVRSAPGFAAVPE